MSLYSCKVDPLSSAEVEERGERRTADQRIVGSNPINAQ